MLHEKEEENDIALIMAGGFGKRLGKKTKNIPKPLIKVGNKALLDIILKKVGKSKFKKIFISTHYLNEKISNHLKKSIKNNNIGLIELDRLHRLKNIQEKPKLHYNVISGIYCLKKKVCDLVSTEYLDMTTLISNAISIKKKIGVFPIYEYWQDIGYPDDLIKANKNYTN